MRKRQSVDVQNRNYKRITGEIKQAAKAERIESLAVALRLCLLEIEQFHNKAYPGCDGGCPAHEAMNAAREALKPPLSKL